MQKIAITGNMGTGKSLVKQILIAHNFQTLDSDEVVARLYQTPEIKDLLQEKFSYYAFYQDGSVNKRWLADKIFQDEHYRFWWQNLLWPKVKSQIELWFFAQEKKQARHTFVIVPLLFEANMQPMFDQTWLIFSQKEDILQRLQVRDKINLLLAKKRLATQIPDEKKRPLVDIIINNYGTIDELKQNVKKQLDQLK
jgi:dephospho-CoA kinase